MCSTRLNVIMFTEICCLDNVYRNTVPRPVSDSEKSESLLIPMNITECANEYLINNSKLTYSQFVSIYCFHMYFELF